ncbi:hypothetical protein A2276_07335 [candidate division WOR-1 bacterium RIFOXYA12_FULL_43_27]|uniref:Uncharacterized protein n=1 Tax=candidate division WOR-1 bacterium RIFOXYC2_FULL_46_14 TaxID=1802587 RepID=A0A1F4U5K9_UNCSA|nr:MAG: hypothetical protein A2276_07335 [candidate division WOR-1 bacterium RIFOXYA12_FULL_43_27]OGC20420.1 MAG: hypothetical protein A2292_05160 [candidate division WOR-1 bacterium RIFOXYB2_FULL_46_45]OGC31843.1 MAG: hypothetical protein A2232_06290 [candidate division WOR-1 bacterium RIFOXYA2_FULL_46_56]OGC40265.1 MAG: hypothetical protein A2438_03180 [candidate division WOR-1 bacterium RIFOXYC2_FULL_46_14]
MKGPITRHYEGFRDHKQLEQGGRIELSGTFLVDHKEEIVNLINHEGRLAEEKNPSHRVSTIEKANGGIVVETTDHNLALKIGKALSHAYKGEHEYKFSKGEKFVEVKWRRDHGEEEVN